MPGYEVIKQDVRRETARGSRGDRRDDEAISKLSEGQTVETPDGWTGFIAEKIPEAGEVYVESWERGGTYKASRVTPTTGTDVTGGL